MSGLSDPIADMLTRIRNASSARKPVVDIPSSSLKQEIARVLKEKGFIKKYVVVEDGKQGILKVLLRYTNGMPAIQGIQRVSRPGLRHYANVEKLPRVLNGLGYAIISTSQGVMTDHEARKQKVGGEVLCKVW
ncbi:MAG: 30S ribosomal protein S8 [Fibromonadaceae bacterium]|jgi:small subunit ribosomal protein S8|nr:30S ribosomal protein S8 [Fibromonadaceae bacterium]